MKYTKNTFQTEKLETEQFLNMMICSLGANTLAVNKIHLYFKLCKNLLLLAIDLHLKSNSCIYPTYEEKILICLNTFDSPSFAFFFIYIIGRSVCIRVLILFLNSNYWIFFFIVLIYLLLYIYRTISWTKYVKNSRQYKI